MLSYSWRQQLQSLMNHGAEVTARGQGTRELLNQHITFNPEFGLMDVPTRNLNYRFAVAEWVWMMFGISAVEPLARYNSKMRDYSDDGVTLTGAYGPHICAQRHLVLEALKRDPNTRQAVIEILRPRRETKDEPCTLSFQFLNRRGRLNLIATMRSSDIWLGVPYDAYTFSMILNCFAGELGLRRGWVTINMGSSHLYERDRLHAQMVLGATADGRGYRDLYIPAVPGMPPFWLEDWLTRPAWGNPGFHEGQESPWAPYAHVLNSDTSDAARDILRGLANAAPVDF